MKKQTEMNTEWIGQALMKKPHSQMTFSNKQALYKDIWQVFIFIHHILDQFICVHILVDNLKFTKEWAKIFSQMKKTRVKQLRIDSNSNTSILKTIAKITFMSLKHLDLADNKIVSIQLMAFVSFKTINQIRISKNMIRNLKPLRKMILESDELSYIDVSDNCISSYQDMCHVNSFALGKIVISWHNQQVYSQNALYELIKLPLLGLHALKRQDKRFSKLLYPQHLIMKKYWTPQIGRENQKIKAKNSKYIRMQSLGQISNTKAQKIIMQKLGNKEKDENEGYGMRNSRDQNKFVLKIFNVKNKEAPLLLF